MIRPQGGELKSHCDPGGIRTFDPGGERTKREEGRVEREEGRNTTLTLTVFNHNDNVNLNNIIFNLNDNDNLNGFQP